MVSQITHRRTPIIADKLRFQSVFEPGMPYPANLDTALSLEKIIRDTSDNTVIPATIALVQGRIHIGLDRGQLERLADPEVSKKSIKVSRRDLAFGVTSRLDGGTTVAGTMLLSHQVGIETFVTGGIGGVHRGAQSSEFISSVHGCCAEI